jgi:hypothetical protein
MCQSALDIREALMVQCKSCISCGAAERRSILLDNLRGFWAVAVAHLANRYLFATRTAPPFDLDLLTSSNIRGDTPVDLHRAK